VLHSAAYKAWPKDPQLLTLVRQWPWLSHQNIMLRLHACTKLVCELW
jgi:hypothetical protein